MALLPTITIEARSWKKGWQGRPFREMVSTIHVVLQGSGRSRIGGEIFEWRFGDVFVAPLWTPQEHSAQDDAVVVALSDTGLMKHALYFRREPCDAEVTDAR
jgi:gentisate 1,2-dioxygenase